MGEGPFALTVTAYLAVVPDFLLVQPRLASFLRQQPGPTILQIVSCRPDRTFCFRTPGPRANDRATPYTSWHPHNLCEERWPCSAWQCRHRPCPAILRARPGRLPTVSMNILIPRPPFLFPP